MNTKAKTPEIKPFLRGVAIAVSAGVLPSIGILAHQGRVLPVAILGGICVLALVLGCLFASLKNDYGQLHGGQIVYVCAVLFVLAGVISIPFIAREEGRNRDQSKRDCEAAGYTWIRWEGCSDQTITLRDDEAGS